MSKNILSQLPKGSNEVCHKIQQFLSPLLNDWDEDVSDNTDDDNDNGSINTNSDKENEYYD